MLPNIIAHCSSALPKKLLWRWLQRELSSCTRFDLDVDGNLCLHADDGASKKLTSYACIKSLAMTDARISVPLMYEICTGLDVHNDTSDMLLHDLSEVLGLDFRHDYVRWYPEPRRLAFDTVKKIPKATLQAHAALVHYTKSLAYPGEWVVLWRYSEHLRSLLAAHLQVKVMGNGN